MTAKLDDKKKELDLNSIADSLKEIGNTITIMQEDINVKWEEVADLSADVQWIKEKDPSPAATATAAIASEPGKQPPVNINIGADLKRMHKGIT